MKTIVINGIAMMFTLMFILLSIETAMAAEKEWACPEPTQAIAHELQLNIEELKQRGDLASAIPLTKCLVVVAGSLFGHNHVTTLNLKKDLEAILRKTGHEVEANAITQELESDDKLVNQVTDTAIQSLVVESKSLLARGDRDGAGKACQQARYLSQLQKLENTISYSAVLNECGRVYEAMGNIPMAKQRYGEAIELARRVDGPKSPALAIALNNLGLLNLHDGQIKQALEQLQEVIKIDGNGNSVSIPTMTNLGMAYAELKNYEEARNQYLAARQLALDTYGQWYPHLFNIYVGLGALAWRSGKIDEAIDWHHQLNLNSEHNLAANLLIGSDLQKQALVRELNGTKDAFISLHLDETLQHSTEAAKIALTTLLQHKGRVQDALGESMAVLHQHASKDEKNLLDSLREVRSEWSALVNRGPGLLTPENYRKRISALEEDASTLEKKLSASSVNLIKQKHPVTLEAVQAALPENAALIELALYSPFNTKAIKQNEKFGEPQYAAYVLHPKGEPCAVKLGAAKDIEPMVETWRRGIDSRSDGVARGVRISGIKEGMEQANISKELYFKVISPIREKCLGNTKTILFSPDGSFNLVPIGALVDDNGRYLIEDYHITYLTSGRDLLFLQNKTSSRGKAVVIADPDYGLKSSKATLLAQAEIGDRKRRSRDFTGQIGAFDRLESAAEEAEAITKLLYLPKEQWLTQKRATEEALKALQGPQILHIATHGFFLPNEKYLHGRANGLTGKVIEDPVQQPENPLLRSGMALAGANELNSGDDDGILTALEVSGLDLLGTKLVVLSACETGLGDVHTGEGVYGLRRALVIAGAESQVLSLWRVNDYGTKDLMLNYYSNLLAGEGRSEALRQAQLAMLQSDKYNHPYYWAAFIPSGDSRPIKVTKTTRKI